MNDNRASGGPPTARELVYRVLIDASDSHEFETTRLDDLASTLSPQDRQFARFLCRTLVSRTLTLETILANFLQRDVEPGLLLLLKMGAAQMLFSPKPDTHAAVNETVETARKLGKPQWCKFLNGVLRNLGRVAVEPVSRQLNARSCPVGTSPGYLQFARPLFPDPDQNFAKYLSAAYSMPLWLIERWVPRFSRDELVAMLEWFLGSNPLFVRVNLHKTTREELVTRWNAAGIETAPGELPGCLILLDRSVAIEDLPGFWEGEFSIQDETAQRAAIALDPQPGDRVLDLCAAPGTKSCHLAERMQNTGSIVACDVSENRLQKVVENRERLNLDIIETQTISPELHDIHAGPFDAILIDAPCTNTGVLGKRVEARWRISEADIAELSELQQQLLERSARLVNLGGKILFSTCSIEPEENEQNIARFLASHPDFELLSEWNFVPGHSADGGYQALLKKK